MTTTTSPITPDSSTPVLDAARRRRLRRGLTAYLATVAVTATGLVLVARGSGADVAHLDQAPVVAQLALFAGAFVPGIAMLVAWIASGIGPDWGFRRCGLRVLAVAWTIPMLAALLAYLSAWLVGVAGFDSTGLSDAAGGIPAVVALPLAVVPGLIPWLFLAAGEQLGWSSWFVVRLAELADRRVVAVALGIGWGLTHVPMMLLIPGAIPAGIPAWFAVTMFLIETVAMAYPMVWLRLSNRSIWPVLVLHAGINASIYFAGDPLTVDRSATDWFLGEGTLLTAVGCAVSVLLTAPWWRRRSA